MNTQNASTKYMQVIKEISSIELKFLAHNLKLVDTKSNLLVSCPICLLAFNDDSKIAQLKCRHVYHTECCTQLITKSENKACALCREEIKVTDKYEYPIQLVNNFTFKCTENRCFYLSNLNTVYDFYTMLNGFTGYFSDILNDTNQNINSNKFSTIKKAINIFKDHYSTPLSLPYVKKPEDSTQQAISCPFPEKIFEHYPLEKLFNSHYTFLCSYVCDTLKYLLPNINITETKTDLEEKFICVFISNYSTKVIKITYLWEQLTNNCHTAMFFMHNLARKIMHDTIIVKLLSKYKNLLGSSADFNVSRSTHQGCLIFNYLDNKIEIYIADFVNYDTLEINDTKFKQMLYLQGIDFDKVYKHSE